MFNNNSTLPKAGTQSSVISRRYSSFRGVDFSGDPSLVDITRSPFSINTWRNYRSSFGSAVETRPGHRILYSLPQGVKKLYSFITNGCTYILAHAGNKLYELNTPIKELCTLSGESSCGFQSGDCFYLLDGASYLRFTIGGSGITVSAAPYVPTTYSIASDGSASEYQQFNVLTGKQKHIALGLASSIKLYPHLKNADGTNKTVTVTSVTVDGVSASYTYNATTCSVSVSVPEGATCVIEFSQELSACAVDNCTVATLYEGRVFFSGNPDYPNKFYYSATDNPNYVGYLDYENVGSYENVIRAFLPVSESLAVLCGGGESTVYLVNPQTLVSGVVHEGYPAKAMICGFPALGAAVNFLNDAVFITKYGLKAVSRLGLHNERAVEHRSTLVDGKLLGEELSSAVLEEFSGYLMLLVAGRIYLADSRSTYINNGNSEYEWFLWDNIGVYEVSGGTADANGVAVGGVDTFYKATALKEIGGKLYFGTLSGKVCVLNTDLIKNDEVTLSADAFGTELLSSAYRDERATKKYYEGDNVLEETYKPIFSCWTTKSDDFGARSRYKTLLKNGALADLKSFTHSACKVRIKTDKYAWREVARHNGGYFDFSDMDYADFTFNTSPINTLKLKVRAKKWERLSVMLYSDEPRKPFGVFGISLLAVDAGAVK